LSPGCVGRLRASAASTSGGGAPMLEVVGLEAEVASTGEKILKGVDLVIGEGEVHAIMGLNGSGKSTLSKCIVGHPAYVVTAGSIKYRGEDLLALSAEERSHRGVFLSFQSPVEIPGVSNTDFLRLAYNAKRKSRGEAELDPLEFYGYLSPKIEKLRMKPSFLNRNVNEGFSGGEKKRNEILQLAVLEADLAILDEIDSGLDIDALRDVASSVVSLAAEKPDRSVLLVTHYQRLLDYIVPDAIHVMVDGKIVRSGDKGLALELEQKGYDWLLEKAA